MKSSSSLLRAEFELLCCGAVRCGAVLKGLQRRRAVGRLFELVADNALAWRAEIVAVHFAWRATSKRKARDTDARSQCCVTHARSLANESEGYRFNIPPS